MVKKQKAPELGVDEKTLLEMYRNAYATRQFELKCTDLYRQGFIRGYLHPYLGEEAIAAGACAALEPSDYIVSTHRGHGHCICKGADLKLMVAEIMGKETGYCGRHPHSHRRGHGDKGEKGKKGGHRILQRRRSE